LLPVSSDLMLLSIKEIILPSPHMISEKLSDTSQLFIQQAESVAETSLPQIDFPRSFNLESLTDASTPFVFFALNLMANFRQTQL
jgi:hypothetical protein